MTENKNSTDINELLPPSLAAVRDIFAEFNVAEVSDEICTRVLDVLYNGIKKLVKRIRVILLRAINPTNRPISVGNPLGQSVHVIAAPGIGPSMIRVQTVQNVAQLSGVDNSGTGLRTLPVGPAVSNGNFL
ncbi:unnamed protein product [Trichobilharzia regenti]|nr:unnamed protein product [Trichobilharzia regenti]